MIKIVRDPYAENIHLVAKVSSLLLGSCYQTFLFLCLLAQWAILTSLPRSCIPATPFPQGECKVFLRSRYALYLVPGLLLNFSHCFGVFLFLRRSTGFFASTNRGFLTLPKLSLVPSQILVHIFPFGLSFRIGLLRTKLNFGLALLLVLCCHNS